ncbi:hypothetical protein TTHERM_00692960 (macronuclear) [Tetrahymena thermophila SB210]|uniref:Uncharacterized protein n=1 Tax=Tetrahymena thermophila (strain SB210) TaxID=312017 RepID=Q245C0_TETTS|nr:hypothetical protein TTHERM_00692960 [Tetrahymena thermophila SB210]EAS03317.1 hypothetical protein TTHERM_00692960 [Tetrahymena thermophila SB210]|eukprot:XP_001023562.1 hypothetical protein TTHERM_00692960 [Tetrahymena thermophila SB210]
MEQQGSDGTSGNLKTKSILILDSGNDIDNYQRFHEPINLVASEQNQHQEQEWNVLPQDNEKEKKIYKYEKHQIPSKSQ